MDVPKDALQSHPAAVAADDVFVDVPGLGDVSYTRRIHAEVPIMFDSWKLQLFEE